MTKAAGTPEVARTAATRRAVGRFNTGVLLLLDTQGLEAHPDHDAVLERKHTYLRDLAWLVAGEFELDPEVLQDHDRLIGLIEGDLEDILTEHYIEAGDGVLGTIYHGPMGRGEGNQRILGALLELAEDGGADEIIEVLTKYYKSNDRDDLPLEWFAYAMQQWRYFVPIGCDRLVRVEIVRPWDDYLHEDLAEMSSDDRTGLPMFDLQSVYDGIDEGDFETQVVYEKKPRPGARLEWHGTDLSRARSAFPRVAGKIVNPWKHGFIAQC
jgi:hypothetical protein